MGFGRVIAAAAAAPILRNYFSQHPRRGSADSDDSNGTVIPARSRSSAFFEQHLRSSQSPDDMDSTRRPLLNVETGSRQAQGPAPYGYGTVLGEGPSGLRTSPERYRRDSWLDRVPEEADLDTAREESDEEADEWDLAQYGYYSGEFRLEFCVCCAMGTSRFLRLLFASMATYEAYMLHMSP